jgi:hypothetical protein
MPIDINRFFRGTLRLGREWVGPERTGRQVDGQTRVGEGTGAVRDAGHGIEVGWIIGISTDLIRDRLVYHTVNDTADRLDPAALMGIRSLLTAFPFVFMAAGMVALSFYPTDAAMHRHMIEEIKAKMK